MREIDVYHNYCYDLKDINRHLLNALKEYASEHECKIEEEWCSKCNKGIVYNREPFASHEFRLNARVIGKDDAKVRFVIALFLKRQEEVALLETALLKECSERKGV